MNRNSPLEISSKDTRSCIFRQTKQTSGFFESQTSAARWEGGGEGGGEGGCLDELINGCKYTICFAREGKKKNEFASVCAGQNNLLSLRFKKLYLRLI